MKLAPIADRIAKRLGDIRLEVDWEEWLQGEINWEDLEWTQSGIVFDMVVARWNREKKQ